MSLKPPVLPSAEDISLFTRFLSPDASTETASGVLSKLKIENLKFYAKILYVNASNNVR